jgi:hypothetical protein
VSGKFVSFYQTGNRAAVRASYARALPIELLSTEPAELSAVPENHAATGPVAAVQCNH